MIALVLVTFVGIILMVMMLDKASQYPKDKPKRMIRVDCGLLVTEEEAKEANMNIDMSDLLTGARRRSDAADEDQRAKEAQSKKEYNDSFEAISSHVQGLQFLVETRPFEEVPGTGAGMIRFQSGARGLDIHCHRSRYLIREHSVCAIRNRPASSDTTMSWDEGRTDNEGIARRVLGEIANWIVKAERDPQEGRGESDRMRRAQERLSTAVSRQLGPEPEQEEDNRCELDKEPERTEPTSRWSRLG
jgi:hypothetical protein